MPIIQHTLVKISYIKELLEDKNILQQEIDDAKTFIKKIEAGNLDVSIELETHRESGLFKALQQMQAQLKKLSEEERKRNWATEGLARFAEIMRKADDLKTFGDHILTNLVHYLKASQGGLFIKNQHEDAEPFLEMIACYAYDRKKFLKKQIMIGEGLVGQIFLEGKTLQMDKIPPNYLSINSGLGASSPHYLLLVPLKQQDEVLGVMELASFQVFEPYQVEFLERITENIASAIANVEMNERTRRLLRESQEQSEMLFTQEEEMRQNNEELLTTQESLKHKQIELEKALQISNEQANLLKEQEKRLIDSENRMQIVIDNLPRAVFWKDKNLNYLGCNKIFAALGGLSSSHEIIGKSDYDMPWGEMGDLYRKDDLRVIMENKAQIDFEEPIEYEGGATSWLRTSKVPLLDAQGEVYGVLGMFEDITLEKERWNNLNQKALELEDLQKKFEQLQDNYNQCMAENIDLKEKITHLLEVKKNAFKDN